MARVKRPSAAEVAAKIGITEEQAAHAIAFGAATAFADALILASDALDGLRCRRGEAVKVQELLARLQGRSEGAAEACGLSVTWKEQGDGRT